MLRMQRSKVCYAPAFIILYSFLEISLRRSLWLLAGLGTKCNCSEASCSEASCRAAINPWSSIGSKKNLGSLLGFVFFWSPIWRLWESSSNAKVLAARTWLHQLWCTKKTYLGLLQITLSSTRNSQLWLHLWEWYGMMLFCHIINDQRRTSAIASLRICPLPVCFGAMSLTPAPQRHSKQGMNGQHIWHVPKLIWGPSQTGDLWYHCSV